MGAKHSVSPLASSLTFLGRGRDHSANAGQLISYRTAASSTSRTFLVSVSGVIGF